MTYLAKEGTKFPKIKDHYEALLIERDAKITLLERAKKEDSKLIKKLTEVVEDFLPNIGKCALQDYGRLNDAMIESKKRLST